jgi:transmembrane sensor
MRASSGQRKKMNAQILEEASTWFVELSEGEISSSVRADFNQWLRMSPEHVRAYLQISALWDDVPLLGKSRHLNAEQIVAQARSRANIVELNAETRNNLRKNGDDPIRRSPRARYVAFAASVALLAVAGLVIWAQSVRGIYSTGVGEQRSITLADGSTVELNARSRVRVQFTDEERRVSLLQGEALFQVGRDVARPFVVLSEGTRVRAVGTQFDVNQTRIGTTVTVVEGRVTVLSGPLDRRSNESPRGGADSVGLPQPIGSNAAGHGAMPSNETGQASPLYLGAGEQVTVTGRSSQLPTRADANAVIAWRERKLHFASAPLTEVAEEYNRYHELQLIIRDPSLASFHVSGVFSATDDASLIAFLRAQPNLNVRETGSGVEITGR